MAARTRKMKFKDSGSMFRFLLMYMDLLVPYSEATIIQANYVGGKGYFNERHNWVTTEHGKHDENITNMMRKGYRIYDSKRVDIHIEAEKFKLFEGMFKKEKIRTGQYMYVFEG